MINRRTVHFSGRVQGVGFRYTVQNVAMQFDVKGFVRNLGDGRVELVAEGPDDQLDGLVEAIQNRMKGFIRQVDTHPSSATGEFTSFDIRH